MSKCNCVFSFSSTGQRVHELTCVNWLSEKPKQKACQCHCHVPIGRLPEPCTKNCQLECEHCKKVATSVLEPEQKALNDTNVAESEQKACICVDYCYTVGGDYECKEECLFCHPDYMPAPSLNSWEEEFEKVWRESMVSSRSDIALEGKNVKQFIASQISLAVQNERNKSKWVLIEGKDCLHIDGITRGSRARVLASEVVSDKGEHEF